MSAADMCARPDLPSYASSPPLAPFGEPSEARIHSIEIRYVQWGAASRPSSPRLHMRRNKDRDAAILHAPASAAMQFGRARGSTWVESGRAMHLQPGRAVVDKCARCSCDGATRADARGPAASGARLLPEETRIVVLARGTQLRPGTPAAAAAARSRCSSLGGRPQQRRTFNVGLRVLRARSAPAPPTTSVRSRASHGARGGTARRTRPRAAHTYVGATRLLRRGWWRRALNHGTMASAPAATKRPILCAARLWVSASQVRGPRPRHTPIVSSATPRLGAVAPGQTRADPGQMRALGHNPPRALRCIPNDQPAAACPSPIRRRSYAPIRACALLGLIRVIKVYCAWAEGSRA
jgi:hypothetical protein